MDENDFSFQREPPADEIAKFGQEIWFSGRNNTAGNSTLLRVEPDGGEFVAVPGSRIPRRTEQRRWGLVCRPMER